MHSYNLVSTGLMLIWYLRYEGLPPRLKSFREFASGAFDTVVATFLFCSVPDPVQGLREVGRVVRPGGQVLLLEHVRIDRPVIGTLMDLLAPLFVRFDGANINRRTVENVIKAGLHIDRVEDLDRISMFKFIVGRFLT